MKISYNWLQDYFEEKLPSPTRIADEITMHSFEVDGVENLPPRPSATPPSLGGEVDVIFDFKILPDRTHDCMSHYGIAREVGMLLDIRPKELKIDAQTTKDFSTHSLASVVIEDDSRCRRAMKRVIKNIKVGESPKWLKDRLESIGQRSINNVVDVANFVMFETGQPVHTFDFDKVSGDTKHISIRSAKEGEKLTALDGKTYHLDDSTLVIADEKEALDIAGIKGGAASGIDENTKSVLLSVCNFEPTMIRKTRMKLGLRTDASDRFERGLSSKLPKLALLRLSYLVQQVAGGELSEDYIDIYPEPAERRHVMVSLSYINKVLGLKLSEEGIEGLFRKLQFGTEKMERDWYRIDIPTNRLDISLPADIVDEIIRVMGYDKLPPTIPELPKASPVRDREGSQREFISNGVNETFYKTLWARNELLSEGYSEVYTYTFREKGEVEMLQSPSNKKFLRTNFSDGVKESIVLNKLNAPLLGMSKIKVFEIGTVFFKEQEVVNICFGDEKNITETTLDDFCKNLEVPDSYGDLLSTFDFRLSTHHFMVWSPYPFISRDIALWVPEEVESEKISKVIKDNAGDLLVKGPDLFDTFTKEGRTSYAFRMVFQSYERTLKDEEVSEIMEKITQEIGKHENWHIR